MKISRIFTISALIISSDAVLASDKCSQISSLYCYHVPEHVNNIIDRTFTFSHGDVVPRDKAIIGLHNVTYLPSPSETNWNAGDFTTLGPVPSVNRRGFSATPNWYGSTAAQLKGIETGLHLHTWSTPGEAITNAQNDVTIKKAKDVPSLQYMYSFLSAPYPWSDGNGNNEFCLGFKAAVPSSYPLHTTQSDYDAANKTANYVETAVVIRDNLTGRYIHLLQQLYDNRGSFSEGFSTDTRVGGFVTTYYGSDSGFSTPITSSNNATGQTWSDYKYFGSCISKANLQNVVQAMNSNNPGVPYSNAPSDYSVVSFMLLNEIGQKFLRDNNGNTKQSEGHLSVKAQEFWAYSYR